jgi:hypothetical protein
MAALWRAAAGREIRWSSTDACTFLLFWGRCFCNLFFMGFMAQMGINSGVGATVSSRPSSKVWFTRSLHGVSQQNPQRATDKERGKKTPNSERPPPYT